jgi:hypothetical protein
LQRDYVDHIRGQGRKSRERLESSSNRSRGFDDELAPRRLPYPLRDDAKESITRHFKSVVSSDLSQTEDTAHETRAHYSGLQNTLSIQAASVRARCEQTDVERGRLRFGDDREIDSTIGVW